MHCWTWTLFIILAYSAFSKSWDIEERGDPFNDPRFKQILRISCHMNGSYPWNCPENSKCVDDPNSQINICVCDDDYINPNPYEFGRFIAGSDEVDESEESFNGTSIANNTSVEVQNFGNISSSNENATSYEYIEVSVEEEEEEEVKEERKTRDVKSKEEEPEDADDNDSSDEDDDENDDAIPLGEAEDAKSDKGDSPESTEPPEDSNTAEEEVEKEEGSTEQDQSKIHAQCINTTLNANYQIQDDDPRWRLLLVPCSETCPTNSECRNGRNCFCKEGYFGDPNTNFTICKGLGLKLMASTFQLLCLFLIAYAVK